MKPQTMELFKKHLDGNKFQIEVKDKNLEFSYDLTDDEVLDLVQSEYGTSIVQPQDELFKVIVKELLKLGVDNAKAIADSNKLSDL